MRLQVTNIWPFNRLRQAEVLLEIVSSMIVEINLISSLYIFYSTVVRLGYPWSSVDRWNSRGVVHLLLHFHPLPRVHIHAYDSSVDPYYCTLAFSAHRLKRTCSVLCHCTKYAKTHQVCVLQPLLRFANTACPAPISRYRSQTRRHQHNPATWRGGVWANL